MWTSFPCFFSGISLIWPNSRVPPHHLWSLCRSQLWIPVLHTSCSWADETHPAHSQWCSKHGSCHALQPWTPASPGRDRSLHQCTVLWAHVQATTPVHGVATYSCASQQREYLSMNRHKVVRFHFIWEAGNVFEQERCPKNFLDSYPPHNHWPWDRRRPPTQHLPTTSSAVPGMCPVHNVHSSSQGPAAPAALKQHPTDLSRV